ncbi:MAG TPA: hypothetical protein VFW42_10015 [Fluviicoccus sp.]|nr:hypothetical protein [Fluviicoccus sp.]
MDNEKHKKLIEAAVFFNEAARKLLVNEKGLHAETLISSVSRISGSLMYRTFGHPTTIEGGTAVLSDKANIFGPKLMNLMLSTLQQLGHKIGEENINTEYASAKHVPISFKESHERLAPFFLKYCEADSMSYYDAAFAAAIATGMLINDCNEVLSVDKGAGVAVYGLVEGTKTAPFPVNVKVTKPNDSAATSKKKPWYKPW